MEDFSRLYELFTYQRAHYGQKIAFAESRADGSLKYYSTDECIQMVNRVSAGFLSILGLKKGDKVGLLAAESAPAWYFIDLGLQQIGLIPVPIHPDTPYRELSAIIKESETHICFVENASAYRKVTAILSKTMGNFRVYSIKKETGITYWKKILREPLPHQLESIQVYRGTIHEDDLSTILFSNRKRGYPIGVLLSHKNIISNVKAALQVIPVNCDKRTISFLPISHAFERVIVYSYIAAGAAVYFSPFNNHPELTLQKLKPHYFTAVPEMISHFYKMLIERAKNRSSFLKKLNYWAIKTGQDYKEKQSYHITYSIKLAIADFLVYRVWRKIFGNKIDGIVIGSAPLAPKLSRLFTAAGISIREGYGLSETAGAISLNRFENGQFKFGTAGIPLPGLLLKIESDINHQEGEILLKGPNIMLGYLNMPDLSSRTIDKNGWLHTGDIGTIEDKQFLKITGTLNISEPQRNQKYISSPLIESKLCNSPFVENCLVIGTDRPYFVTVISPDFYFLQQWCEEQKISFNTTSKFLLTKKIQNLFARILDEYNQQAAPLEKVKRFYLTQEKWTIANGLFTPSFKPRRDAIYNKYKSQIEAMYKAN